MFGTTFKYITQEFSKISDGKSSGYDIDCGLIYKFSGYSLGFLIQQGPRIKWATGTTDEGNITTKLGISKKFMFRKLYVLPAIDFVQTKNYPLYAYFGLETGYRFWVADFSLRSGINGIVVENRYSYMSKINNSINYSLGFGIKTGYLLKYYGLSEISFDYVFSIHRLGNKHRASLGVYF